MKNQTTVPALTFLNNEVRRALCDVHVNELNAKPRSRLLVGLATHADPVREFQSSRFAADVLKVEGLTDKDYADVNHVLFVARLLNGVRFIVHHGGLVFDIDPKKLNYA